MSLDKKLVALATSRRLEEEKRLAKLKEQEELERRAKDLEAVVRCDIVPLYHEVAKSFARHGMVEERLNLRFPPSDVTEYYDCQFALEYSSVSRAMCLETSRGSVSYFESDDRIALRVRPQDATSFLQVLDAIEKYLKG